MLMKNGSLTVLYVAKALFGLGLVCGVGSIGKAQEQQSLVSCKPMGQKTGEFGCWILASQPLGTLARPVYWTLDVFQTKELAEHAKGPGGTVVEALGKVWLFTVGEKLKAYSTGTRMTQIGPLPINEGQKYTAQYMEATLQPGMVSKTHVHSGVEVFYTESGETCLETPAGKQLGKKGVDIVIPEGVSMELTATGTEARRGMMLVLHNSSKPATTLVDIWKSKKLCMTARTDTK
jgi:quercetin dioxygenase-like cupin family protein